MICSKCNVEKEDRYFLKDMDICAKCIYHEKLDKMSDKLMIKYCKVCDKELIKGRWSYCSEECSREAHRLQNRNHWTRKVSTHIPLL